MSASFFEARTAGVFLIYTLFPLPFFIAACLFLVVITTLHHGGDSASYIFCWLLFVGVRDWHRMAETTRRAALVAAGRLGERSE
jgi:hypothetical protein